MAFDPYKGLAMAIVQKAAEDYVDLLAGFITPKADCNEGELLRFFHSQWFGLLCDLDPEWFVRKLKERAKSMVIKYDVSKEKGSSRYFVCPIGQDKTNATGEFFKDKKKALHRAAELNDLEYKDYMRCRRRDNCKVKEVEEND